MAAIKVRITEDHLKLIKHLNWDFDLYVREGDEYKLPKVNEKEPFGHGHIYGQLNLLLGSPRELGGANDMVEYVINDELQAKYDKLLLELPLAIDVVMYTQKFETGLYKRKSNFRDWKKIED